MTRKRTHRIGWSSSGWVLGWCAWWVLVGATPVLAQGGGNKSDAQMQPKLDLRHLWNFDKDQSGKAPAGFASATVGGDPSGAWTVEADLQAPSVPNRLSQTTACASSDCLQILTADGIVYNYVDASVRLRALSETGRKAVGGVVFRAKNEKNFYAAMVDVAGDTLDILRVVEGRASLVERKTVKRKAGPWHHLRVHHDTILSKDMVEVFFDGQLVFSDWDPEIYGGQVGLATRGESAVAFDNFHAIQLYSQKPLSSPAAY